MKKVAGKCVVCTKDIKRLSLGDGELDVRLLENATRLFGVPGYGSDYDYPTQRFSLMICDECTEKRLTEHIIAVEKIERERHRRVKYGEEMGE